MSRRSSLFLIVGSLLLASAGLLLVSWRPAGAPPAADVPAAVRLVPDLRSTPSPPAPELPVLDPPVKGPTIAIIDSGLPRIFDRTHCRVVGVHDFTGEGPWDEHGHGTLVSNAKLLFPNPESNEKITAFVAKLQKAGKTKFEEDFRKVMGEVAPDAVRGFNVIFLKVIDRFGETTPVRVLRAVEAVAREEVNTVIMSLNIWLPENEATDYFEGLARAARSSRAIWTAAWPNDADSHDRSRELPFPANSPYVLAGAYQRLEIDSGKPPPPGRPGNSTLLVPNHLLPTVLPTFHRTIAEYELGRAKDHMARKEYDRASHWYLQYLPSNLTDSAAWTNLGVAFKNTGDLETALAVWEIAIEADPKAKEAYYNLAFTLYEGEREPEALAAVRGALRADPDFAHARALLGTLLIIEGQLKEGIGHYKRATELASDNPYFWRNLVRGYFTASATDKSILKDLLDPLIVEAASKAYELDDTHLLPNFILGIRCMKQKEYESCIEHFTKVIKNFDVRDTFDRHMVYDQYLPLVHLWLSESLAAVGRNAEAKEHYNKAIMLDPSVSTSSKSRGK